MKLLRIPAAVLALTLTAGCNFTQPPPGNGAASTPAPATEQAPFRLRPLVAGASLNITPDLPADLIIAERRAQIVLPPVAAVPLGRAYVVQAADVASIRPSGNDTIGGSRGVALDRGESRMFVAAGNGRWLAVLDGAER